MPTDNDSPTGINNTNAPAAQVSAASIPELFFIAFENEEALQFSELRQLLTITQEYTSDNSVKADEPLKVGILDIELLSDWIRNQIYINDVRSKVTTEAGYNSNFTDPEKVKEGLTTIESELDKLTNHPGVKQFLIKFANQNGILFRGQNAIEFYFAKIWDGKKYFLKTDPTLATYKLNKGQNNSVNCEFITPVFTINTLDSRGGTTPIKNDNGQPLFNIRLNLEIQPVGDLDARFVINNLTISGEYTEKLKKIPGFSNALSISNIIERIRYVNINNKIEVEQLSADWEKLEKFYTRELAKTYPHLNAKDVLQNQLKYRLSNENIETITKINQANPSYLKTLHDIAISLDSNDIKNSPSVELVKIRNKIKEVLELFNSTDKTQVERLSHELVKLGWLAQSLFPTVSRSNLADLIGNNIKILSLSSGFYNNRTHQDLKEKFQINAAMLPIQKQLCTDISLGLDIIQYSAKEQNSPYSMITNDVSHKYDNDINKAAEFYAEEVIVKPFSNALDIASKHIPNEQDFNTKAIDVKNSFKEDAIEKFNHGDTLAEVEQTSSQAITEAAKVVKLTANPAAATQEDRLKTAKAFKQDATKLTTNQKIATALIALSVAAVTLILGGVIAGIVTYNFFKSNNKATKRAEFAAAATKHVKDTGSNHNSETATPTISSPNA